jgi:serine phosphatase RsbU (regulator of sigma subunit)
MGKGVGAAILAAGVRATIRMASRTHGVRSTMVRTATALVDDLAAAGSFSTLFHARLEIATGLLTYVDAGHGLTLVIRADGSTVRLRGRHLPLGLEAPDAWQEESIRLEPGDTLLVFSDGLLDFFDDEDATHAFLTAFMTLHGTPRRFVDALIERTPVTQADDCTIIAVQRLPL